MSRDINKFEKPEMWYEFKKSCKEELNLDIIATSVDRDYKEQYAYFCQDREPLDIVNKFRKIAGLEPITQAENKYKVTWTLLSDHVVNLEDERLDNDKSRAIDFAVIYKGEVIWSLKADVNSDNVGDYDECIKIAERIGFKSGKYFKNPDYPHIYLSKKV